MNERDDTELLRLYIQREAATEEAFAAIVARHGQMVFNTCLRILGNAAQAEDAAQATFMVLARRANAISGALAPFLHGVAVNAARSLRDAERLRRSREQDASRQRAAIANPSMPAEPNSALDEAVQSLPRMQKSALILHYVEGLSQEDAAKSLGVSRTTIETHLNRGLEKLRRTLSRDRVQFSTAAVLALLAAPQAACPANLSAALRGLRGSPSHPLTASTAKTLADGVIRNMIWAQIKTVSITAAVILLMLGGAIRFAVGGENTPPPSAPPMPHVGPVGIDEATKWGDAVNGLRAGIHLAQEGPVIRASVYIKNETDKAITFLPLQAGRGWKVAASDGTAAQANPRIGAADEDENLEPMDAGIFRDAVSIPSHDMLTVSKLSYVASFFNLQPAPKFTISYAYELSLDLWGSNREASPAMIQKSFDDMKARGTFVGKLAAPSVEFELPRMPDGSLDQTRAQAAAQAAAERALSAYFLKSKTRFEKSTPPGKDGDWIAGSKAQPIVSAQADGWTFEWNYVPKAPGMGFHAEVKVEPLGKTVVRRVWCTN